MPTIEQLKADFEAGKLTHPQYINQIYHLTQNGEITWEQYDEAKREVENTPITSSARASSVRAPSVRASSAVALSVVGWFSVIAGVIPFLMIMAETMTFVGAIQLGLPAIIGGIVFIAFGALIDYVFYIHEDVQAIRAKFDQDTKTA